MDDFDDDFDDLNMTSLVDGEWDKNDLVGSDPWEDDEEE